MPLSNDSFQPIVLPRPVSLELGEGAFLLAPEKTVIVVDEQTEAIGGLLADTLNDKGGIVLPVLTEAQPGASTIALEIDSKFAHLGTEGYTLKVSENQVLLRAAAPAGLFYATRTLLQLFTPDLLSFSKDEKASASAGIILAVTIEDCPRFSWRGCMLDTSRHFISTNELLKLIDALSLHKINILHLHLTDDQGWRIEIKKYPRLTEVGSRRRETVIGHAFDPRGYDGTPHGGFYTQDELRALSEVMEIFPSPFIHIGGDEAIKDQWRASPQVQARIKELGLKDEDELQSWFVSRIGSFLEQHGRRLVGWDEILEGGLPAGATVMSWRGIEGGIAAARMDHDVVMTPQTHVYLDHYQWTEQEEPLAIGGYTPLDTVYAYEPIPAVLTPEQARHVLGVQCNLWTEYIPTSEHLEYMLFPRALALAKISWTPREQLDFTNFLDRLFIHEARLRRLNVNSRPLERE